MYEMFSQVFIILIFAAYLVIAAALAFWALGGRVRLALKNRSTKRKSHGY